MINTNELQVFLYGKNIHPTSPMFNKIYNWVEYNPHYYFLYNEMTKSYPNANPLLVLDIVTRSITRELMCNLSICCICGSSSGGLILTMFNDMPAPFCSTTCIKKTTEKVGEYEDNREMLYDVQKIDQS